MPLSHLAANPGSSVGGKCGGEGGKGWESHRLAQGPSLLGKGLEVALLPLIPGFPHLPSRPWGRGSVVSRVVWARQARKGWGDPPVEGPHLCKRMAGWEEGLVPT